MLVYYWFSFINKCELPGKSFFILSVYTLLKLQIDSLSVHYVKWVKYKKGLKFLKVQYILQNTDKNKALIILSVRLYSLWEKCTD